MWEFSALLSFEGNWHVAANSPNLTPSDTFPINGTYWNAVTASPTVPETAPPGLPGISGLLIQQGDKILWNAPAGNDPSADAFQPYYLQIRAAAIEAEFGLNEIGLYGPENVYLTNDDTYRRILTWHLYKGDGNYFSTEFIKRRVWRFLYCADGLSSDYAVNPNGYTPYFSGNAQLSDDYIADKRQISVTLGVDRNVTIRFVMGKRTIGPVALPYPPPIHAGNGGAMINYLGVNGFNPAFGVTPPWDIGFETKGGCTPNDLETSYEKYGPLPFMYIFKQALDLGVLEVPYQYNFTCYIG
jgi:hypothetical protein